jgi:hypothetical protein
MYNNSSTWINGLVQGANNTVTQIFHTGYEAVASLTNFIRHLIPDSVQRDASLLAALNQYKTSLKRIDIEREKLKHIVRTDAKYIELREKEIELQGRELELKRWFYNQKLSLIQKHHEESVQLKLQEFQNNWDVHRSFFSLSREDTQKLFQTSGKFWILLSPPKIETSVPGFESLCTKVEHSINQTVSNYYLTASNIYPIGFRQIFDRPITAFEAVHTREFLAPVPTLILSSVVTEHEVYMTLTFPNPIDSYNDSSNDKQISLPSWNWEEMKVSLESTGKSSQDSIHAINSLIAIIHTILAVYFCDIYCLSIDPYHEPKLFDFLQNSGFSEAFQKLVEPYQTYLRQLQESLRRRLSSSPNYDINFKTVAALIVLGIMFLLGMCNSNPSHNSPEVAAVNKSKKIVKKSSKSGIPGIIKANSSGYNAVVLRAAPSVKAKEVSKLLNGTDATLWEFSDDNQWRRVTTLNKLSGWVWAKSVQEKSKI